MAERVVVVCDECGRPAQASVTFKVAGRNLAKDLCQSHLEELVRNSHPPKRGRRPSSTAPRGGGLPKSSGRRRGPGSRKASPKARMPKTTRAKITDPETLKKRRAALEKARRVLAERRAAAKAV